MNIDELTGMEKQSCTKQRYRAVCDKAQMLVITTGEGNIDLSIPGMVTLSAYLS